MRLLFLAVVLVAVGCGPQIVYESTQEVGDSWAYEEQLLFDFDISDTATVYQLEFELSHSTDYPYQNLYVKVGTTYPDGHLASDVVSLSVADKRGEYYGECSGSECMLPIQLHERFRFQQLGRHQISIEQHSRTVDLSDVYGGTLRLVVAETKK